MNSKKYSFTVCIFSILNTIQFLLLDINCVRDFGYKGEAFSIHKDSALDHDSWLTVNIRSLKVGMSLITLVVSCILLYCIYMNVYMGLLVYAVWIIISEFINLTVAMLIKDSLKPMFEEMNYLLLIFQISRMLLHFCYLPFIIKYMLVLYKDPKTSSKMSRHRHSSFSTVDSWSPVGLALHRKIK